MTERAKENDRNNHQQQGPDEQTHMEESASENITKQRQMKHKIINTREEINEDTYKRVHEKI